MKAPHRILLSIFILIGTLLSNAQIITTNPALPLATEAVIINFDATLGTGGLEGYTGDVYAHTGVLTKLSRVSEDQYSLDISPSIREYYGVAESETITHMAFVFRSSNSSLQGKDEGEGDIFVEVFQEGLSISIINPDRNTIVDPGSSVLIEAAASDESISHTFPFASPGDYWIRVTADADGETVADDDPRSQ